MWNRLEKFRRHDERYEKDSDKCLSIVIGRRLSYMSITLDEEQEPLIIPNKNYKCFSTPVFVTFGDDDVFFGEKSQKERLNNSNNTIFDFMSLIGLYFDDPYISDAIKTKKYPFKIIRSSVKNKKNFKIEICVNNVKKSFYVKEILSFFILHLKRQAEDYLKKNIRKVVSCCQVRFKDNQRQCIKDSFLLAGLNLLRISNIPLYCCLGYGFEKVKLNKELTIYENNSIEKTIMVFDFGAKELNISVLLEEEGIFEVLKFNHFNFGGDDISMNLVEYFCDFIQRKYKKNIRMSPKAMDKLFINCEKVKIELSKEVKATIFIKDLVDDFDFKAQISRKKFESLNHSLFTKCVLGIKNIFKIKAEYESKKINSVDDIQFVILAGGSCYIPKVQSLIMDYFNNKELCKKIAVDHLACLGAAKHGFLLIRSSQHELHSIGIIPLSFSIEGINGKSIKLVQRNSTTPLKRTTKIMLNQLNFKIGKNNGVHLNLKLFEGEREKVKDNFLVFDEISCVFKSIKDPNSSSIEIEFIVDIDEEIAIEITHEKESFSFKIKKEMKRKLTNEEIEEILKEAEKMKVDDDLSSLQNIFPLDNNVDNLEFEDLDVD